MTDITMYQTEFLRRAQNLKYQGRSAGKKIETYNPLCGDRQNIYLETKDGTVTNITFEPEGCMVSKVATDLVAENFIGKKVDDIKSATVEHIEELLATKLTPSRRKCANLGLSAIQDNL